MRKINARNLYYFIINHLDEQEIAKPTTATTILYDKVYYENNTKSVNVVVPSPATFLLSQLWKKWDEMVSIKDLEWWLKLSTAHKNQRSTTFRYKYEGLIVALKQGKM